MRSHRRLSPVLLMFILFLCPVSLSAAWPLEGIPICSESSSQSDITMVEDGAGGVILIFVDDRYGNFDIFAQRFDSSGDVLWNPAGVPVCTITGSQLYPEAVSDGAGGAVITWQDYRGGVSDVYAQRIDASGTRLWHTAGLAICTATGSQYLPKISPDGTGGGIIAWEDWRNGNGDIYARRVDSDGNVLWTVLGVAICTESSRQYEHQIASDGAGGSFIVWRDRRDGNSDIYFDRVYSDGSLVWGSNGLDVCSDPASQDLPRVINVGNGSAVFAWRDFRNSTVDIYAQLTIGIGRQWVSNGIQVCAVLATILSNIEMIQDSDGGIVICWDDDRGWTELYGIYAQRLLMSGVVDWNLGGVLVADEPLSQSRAAIISDDVGGTIVSWLEDDLLGSRVNAQRLDSNGNTLWNPDGVRIAPLTLNQSDCHIIPDGEGGAIAAWIDDRDGLTSPKDIFAQRMDRHGYIGSPEPVVDSVSDIPMDQGGKVELTWDASYLDLWPYQEITYYSIWKSLSPASAMMLKEDGIEFTDLQTIDLDTNSKTGMPSGMIIRREILEAATYYWELLETQPAQYYEGYSKVLETDFTSLPTAWTYSYYQVAAHTSDPLVVWTSQPDSAYSLDNLSPAPPVGLAGEQEYSPEGMDLIWNTNQEEDLSHYVIYRGTDPSFVPSTITMLTTAYDTMFFDGGWNWEDGYFYKVSAVDIHDNESGFALLLPGQVTGDDPPTPSHSDYLSQNWPNPFNPSTTIQFGLKESGHVRLNIYDASGRLVSELVNSTLPAGNYSEIWNGTNSSGAYVASGIYFYRLDAGEFSMKKKMVLLR